MIRSVELGIYGGIETRVCREVLAQTSHGVGKKVMAEVKLRVRDSGPRPSLVIVIIEDAVYGVVNW